MHSNTSHLILKKRRQYDLLFAQQEIFSGTIDGILEYRDVSYHIDGKPTHMMNIFRPLYRPDPLPIVLHIHGGGLVTGTRHSCRKFCAALAEQGLLVFSMDYRLVPDVTFFQQLEDVFTAMDYIDVTAGQYGGEPGYIYLLGEDAGALLAYYACAIQYCPILRSASELSPALLPIERMALISGMYYPAKASLTGKQWAQSIFGADYRKSPFYPYLDPGDIMVCNSISPTLMITSENDILRRETIRLSKTMTRHRIPHLLQDYGSNPSLTHAFPVRYPSLCQGKEAIEKIGNFFGACQQIPQKAASKTAQ